MAVVANVLFWSIINKKKKLSYWFIIFYIVQTTNNIGITKNKYIGSVQKGFW